jgi:alpha-tubulin suppressor-like RCC1 family protein
MAYVRVQSVVAELSHSLALSWDGRVYSWGDKLYGQLGHGDKSARPSPALVEGLEGVRSIAASPQLSVAVTQAGAVFSWGISLPSGAEGSLRPIVVTEFGGVRVRRVCPVELRSFAIGEDGELFSWGRGHRWVLGHGDTKHQPSPKRVEALRGIRVSSVSIGVDHALALTGWYMRGV